MMEPHDSSRVYENIAPSLADVPFGFHGETAVRELFEVSPPCAWTPYIPKARFEHAIGPVELALRIDQKRPAKARVLDIGTCKKSSFEGDDCNLHVALPELGFVLLQLHQMSTAGQSPQVPVKYHQKPCAPIIIEAVSPSLGIREIKSDSGLSNHTAHRDYHSSPI
jgi:hypothetical protein